MKDIYEYLEEIQDLISYSFKNEDLLVQAFTRKSFSVENGGENNETLEFIGDQVLGYYVTKIIIDRYGFTYSYFDDYNEETDLDEFSLERYDTEASLTKLKQRFINGKMLAHRIDKLGFKDFLIMGEGDVKSNTQDNESVKEDLFEALLGAVAIDSNWNPDELENTVNFMLNMDHYLLNNFTEENDYVSLIQQWNQKENDDVPVYEFEEMNDGGFIAYLNLIVNSQKIEFRAAGSSKSKARYAVAEYAYKDLEENGNLFTILDDLPKELNLDNSINTLQELSQKGYFSIPEYFISEEQDYDEDGNPIWMASCTIKSYSLTQTAYASSKKEAKKYSAYLCIIDICGLENEIE